MKSKSNTYDIIIIGAGAAGLFHAAGCDEPAGGSRLILEKTSRPGQKLLMSGSGMCNITHGGFIKDFVNHYGDNGTKIRSCLYRHSNLELMKMCEESGVPLVEREDGKVFPVSMKARDILDMLIAKAKHNGFEMQCGAEVTGITPQADGLVNVRVKYSGACSETELSTGKLVIATGGASYPATGSDGTFMEIISRGLNLETEKLRPALAPVYVENYPYGNLSGISFEDVEVSCNGHTLRGPMLLTHRGFSGPAMLHISQYVQPGKIISINYLPDRTVPEVFHQLKAEQPGNSKGIANYLAGAFGLPKAFAETMFSDPSRKFSTIGHKELENVAHLMTDRKHTVSGTGGFNEAMVTAGGVKLEDVDTKTMSLKAWPQIKVIGEALDVNGDTGGYNLQFAYSSAMAAAKR